jgi:FXSXX-COOH protein
VATEESPTGHDLQTQLSDVTKIALAGLELLDESVLTNCLHRYLREAERPDHTLSGFQSVL